MRFFSYYCYMIRFSDEDHFVCQECFSSYVDSECTLGNPESVCRHIR